VNKANTDCVLLQHSRSTRYLLMWFGQEMVSKTNTHCMLLLHSVEEAIANCCGPTGDLSRVLNLTHREEYTHTHTQRTHIDFKANLCCRVPRSQRRATHTNTHTYTHTYTHSALIWISKQTFVGGCLAAKEGGHTQTQTHTRTHTHTQRTHMDFEADLCWRVPRSQRRATHTNTHTYTHSALIWISKQTFVGGCLAAKEG